MRRGRLVGPKLANQLTCEACHAEADRDHNAAKNLRDLSETHASPNCR
jgi:transposase